MPDQYPSSRYYRSGRYVVVHTEDEERALPSGWALSSYGPWADGLEGRVTWTLDQGPFKVPPLVERHPDALAVWSTRPVVFEGWARAKGEAFLIHASAHAETLIAAGVLARFSALSQHTYRYVWTGRLFIDREALSAHHENFLRNDVSDFVPPAPLPDTVCMPGPEVQLPEDAPPRQRGHPRDAWWRSVTYEDLLGILQLAVPKARQRHPDKKRPSMEDVADAAGYSRRDISLALGNCRSTWKKIRPLIGA
jgi:hypothetical protein